MNSDKRPAIVPQHEHFVNAVQTGECFESRAEIVRRTRDLMFMKGDLVAGSRVVATAGGIWKIMADERSGQEAEASTGLDCNGPEATADR